MKVPTVFFGASSYVIPLIDFLNKNYNLKLVVTTEQKSTDPVVNYCTEQNIPYVSVRYLNDVTIHHKLSSISAPFAVLADFRLMVKKDVLDLFPKGIINIHPSLLPEYRGPTPGTTALLDGKKETGVSLMLLDTKLDHGPLLGQVTEHILPADTSVTLYNRLFAKGAQLLQEKLPLYLEGTLLPAEQDNSKATYTDFLTRESGFIDSSKLPTTNHQLLDRMIRAYYPWPSVWTLLRLPATEGQATKEVRMKLLPDKMLQMEGKKPVSYKDFINGYSEGKEILKKLGLMP